MSVLKTQTLWLPSLNLQLVLSMFCSRFIDRELGQSSGKYVFHHRTSRLGKKIKTPKSSVASITGDIEQKKVHLGYSVSGAFSLRKIRRTYVKQWHVQGKKYSKFCQLHAIKSKKNPLCGLMLVGFSSGLGSSCEFQPLSTFSLYPAQ